MSRSFALCDGDAGGRPVGSFTYDMETKEFSMSIRPEIPADELPLSLEGFAGRNKYELSHADALRWVRARICPPGRHNIKEILRDNGLAEYDEFGLLMVCNGRCDRDGLYLA